MPPPGEIEIIIGEDTHYLRPTFKAIVRIERALRTKTITLLQDMAMGHAGIEQLAIIIHHGIQGDKKEAPLTVDEIGQHLIGRFQQYSKPVAEFLAAIVEAKPTTEVDTSKN